ncbi:MAG: hypothetical protein ACJ792_11595 [Gemmatimonadaceae bacterium]
MQTAAQQTSAPQAAPAQPAQQTAPVPILPANPVVVIPGAAGSPTITIPGPRSAREIDALKARREELSTQLNSVDGRRNKLLKQLRDLGIMGDPTAKQGLEGRLALLDQRQLQLESDLALVGQQLSSAPAGMVSTTRNAPLAGGFGTGQVMALSNLSIIFVLFPIAVGIGRTIWKRGSTYAGPPAIFTETAQRLERLEGSVDAIAIEVERISEGQRFVTKLLSNDQAAPRLGVGEQKGIPVSK